MSQYHKLYTPQDSAIVFIDHQPQMLFGVANADRAALINNVTLLARVAKEFNVPAVLTAVETESFSGLLDVFPGQAVVERSSMNSWDDAGFRKAIEATGKKNIVMTGLWTEVCVTWPTIEMLGAGFNIYVVEDCCGGCFIRRRISKIFSNPDPTFRPTWKPNSKMSCHCWLRTSGRSACTRPMTKGSRVS